MSQVVALKIEPSGRVAFVAPDTKGSEPLKLEIWGLKARNNGRTCVKHPRGCGKSLKEGQFVVFQETEVEYNGRLEGAVGAYRYNVDADLAAGEPEECLVGFLARAYWPFRSYFLDRCGQITLKFDEVDSLWHYSHSNAGVAAFRWHDILGVDTSNEDDSDEDDDDDAAATNRNSSATSNVAASTDGDSNGAANVIFIE